MSASSSRLPTASPCLRVPASGVENPSSFTATTSRSRGSSPSRLLISSRKSLSARCASRTRSSKNSAKERQGKWNGGPPISRACRMRSRSSLEGHIRLRRRADIGRARPNEPIVVLLLDDVRAPAGDARADEDRRVEGAGKPYQEGGHGGVEVPA